MLSESGVSIAAITITIKIIAILVMMIIHERRQSTMPTWNR